MSSETSSTAGEGDAVQSLRDKLQRMGKCVLEHMFNHHQSLIASHRLLFLTARMPPFTHDKGPQCTFCTYQSMPYIPCHIILHHGTMHHLVLLRLGVLKSHVCISTACSVCCNHALLCIDPAPSADSMVQLKWPDHLMIVSEMQAQDMMESGVFPDLLAAGREERKEEVMVYHSLANDRACHMVLPEGVPPQVYLHLDKWYQFIPMSGRSIS